jgi:poly-gamma-glutamate synthesis protein (capsule biosynthesis protein)
VNEINTIRIAAIGDVAFNGGYEELARQGAAGRVAEAIAPLLAGADIAIGNLEGPLTNRPSAGPPWRFCLHGHPSFGPALKKMGLHAVSLANNHMMDHGWEAAQETAALLGESGIRSAGAGQNLEEARKAAHFEIHGSKVAILSYCDVAVLGRIYADDRQPGIALARREYVIEDVTRAKSENDIVIVCLHWGQEHVRYPNPQQRIFANEIIAAGASLVIGHHPHVLQGVERFQDGAIAYSLGNFTFSDQAWSGQNQKGESFVMQYRLNENSRRTAVWNVLLDTRGKVVSEQLVPCYVAKDLMTAPDPRPECQRAIERNASALSTPGYRFFWAVNMVLARLKAITEQFDGTDSFAKRIVRLRPRHLRYLGQLLVREWEQLRGME